MDYGLGLLNYYGCWDDVAFAEQHGFQTAGFVESPLLAGDPFVCLGLAAQATSHVRLGTFLSIPGLRDATTLAGGIATVNRLAPGRVFLAAGTGYTARDTFGLGPVAAERVRDTALTIRGLLAGEEVEHTIGKATRAIRFRHEVRNGCVDTEHPVPIYIAGDGPKALRAAGEAGDGLIVTLKNADAMGNAPEVLQGAIAQVSTIADEAGRSFENGYVMWSSAICVLEPGESAVSPRALDHIGAACMMAFHSYACHPEISDFLPPPIRDRIEIYERNVLSRFPRETRYQEVHAGHLAHMLEGEAEVLTEDIVRMTSLTGTATEIADQLRRLEAAGLSNMTFWVPPHLTRSVVRDVEEQIMPLMRQAAAA
ncbi:MAG TPA: LLM class flavin-dependent oxidoreductase [Solirubrobacteraceae bacterium]|jgi:alkanesulfonate monooxygenase SsuD/methylene tetrahydromethanopterin reductase-like flavin-dependent oxidoreductase (luciferase family)|nr:LLM class flavin-dependent oxidoreductase [Solirubrobacteraceae bacterium]